MPMFDQPKTANSFFKPDYKVDYKPVDGKFQLYDIDTKTKTFVDSIEFFPIYSLQKITSKEMHSSNMFDNLFLDKIHVRDADFKYIGTYTYNKNLKNLVDIESTDEADFKAQTTIFVVALTPENKVITIELKGVIKMDLTVKKEDGSNADKIRLLKKSTYIKLTPQKTPVKVGKKPAVKDIYFLDIIGEDMEYSPEQKQLGEEVFNAVKTELEFHQKGNTNVPQKDDTATEADALAAFGGSDTSDMGSVDISTPSF